MTLSRCYICWSWNFPGARNATTTIVFNHNVFAGTCATNKIQNHNSLTMSNVAGTWNCAFPTAARKCSEPCQSRPRRTCMDYVFEIQDSKLKISLAKFKPVFHAPHSCWFWPCVVQKCEAGQLKMKLRDPFRWVQHEVCAWSRMCAGYL